MLKELIISVVSGLIIALILQLFGVGNSGNTAPRQSQSIRNYNYAPPKRRSFFGRLVRLVLSVVAGIAFAQAAAPFIMRRQFGDFDRYERFDRFDGVEGLANFAPIIILTVIGTAIAYMILSALTRR
jgi:hypothetical protein